MDFRKNRLSFLVLLNFCVILIVHNSYPHLIRTEFPSTLDHLKTFLVESSAAEAEERDIMRFEDSFDRSSTVHDLLLKYNFSPQEAQRLIDETRDVYNLNRVMAGNQVLIEFADKEFRSLRYEISDEEFLTIVRQNGAYLATRDKYQFDTVVEEFYGRIEGSLWNTLVSQGEDHRLVIELINILRWDVPFTAIQPGDSFKLIVEKKYRDGSFVKYGRIHAIEFRRGERSYYAFLFHDPETGKDHYYDENGNSVRKAFLKVPFQFNPRVTSRFSHSRFHPILKIRRPHLGIDFGAPIGTPVIASASGVVVFAGYHGGFGRTVRIRHANGYVTSYAHLSRIHVRVGQAVSQGDVIARVGSTGLSTGPHLDFRVSRHGRFVN
ncbi:MAG TPA: peptidoglycan DD-metalloendopeptidase family protein, partial [Acidobacteriota bacterium]|nr:peptidoglycan DD-metalloendopeptidase family protein [Acidobacteriota bacterium]